MTEKDDARSAIGTLMDRLGSDEAFKEKLGAMAGDFIRDQLKRESPLKTLLPIISGPYRAWREDDRVTHWSGFVNHEHVRMCDFRAILMGAACQNEPISCFQCLSMPER